MPDCTSANTRCDECRLASTRIHSYVKKEALNCPKEVYPVIYTLSFTGSNSEANELLHATRGRFLYTFKGGLLVRGAVREAAKDGGKSKSQWQGLDGTVAMIRLRAAAREEARMEMEARREMEARMEAEARMEMKRWQDARPAPVWHRRYKRPSALKRASRWIGLLVPDEVVMERWEDPGAHYRDGHPSAVRRAGSSSRHRTPAEMEMERIQAAGDRRIQREMSMLVDFPVDVQDGDSFDKVFCMEFGDKFKLTNRSSSSDSGNASLHRLNWLSMVHPEDKPEEDEPEEDEPGEDQPEEEEHEDDE